MIKSKPKKCSGTGKAAGHGCGKPQLNRRYGLGYECGCFKNWLINSNAGKETLNKTLKISRKKVYIEYKREEKQKKEQVIDYSKKLQEKINEIVRLIDIGQPCLARGYHPDQIHAGHIFSRGSNKQMRYNLHNIHRQAAQSNHFQNEDGLLREGLKNEYGEDYFNFISELRRTPTLNYSNAEFKLFYKKASEIALRLKREGGVFSKHERIEMRNKINIELGIYIQEYCLYNAILF